MSNAATPRLPYHWPSDWPLCPLRRHCWPVLSTSLPLPCRRHRWFLLCPLLPMSSYVLYSGQSERLYMQPGVKSMHSSISCLRATVVCIALYYIETFQRHLEWSFSSSHFFTGHVFFNRIFLPYKGFCFVQWKELSCIGLWPSQRFCYWLKSYGVQWFIPLFILFYVRH